MDQNQKQLGAVFSFRIRRRISLHLFIVSSISTRTENPSADLCISYLFLTALVITCISFLQVILYCCSWNHHSPGFLHLWVASQGFINLGGPLCFYNFWIRLVEQMQLNTLTPPRSHSNCLVVCLIK